MCFNPFLRPFAVNRKNTPEPQTILTHPFLGEFATEPFALVTHPAPILVIRYCAPWPNRSWRFEETQLSGPAVIAGQYESFNPRIIGDACNCHSICILESGGQFVICVESLKGFSSSSLAERRQRSAHHIKLVRISSRFRLALSVNV